MMAMIVIPAPPVAAEAAPAWVQAAPIDAIYARAVEDRRGGRNRAAIAGLEQVLAARPTDVDARLNLGLTLLAENRLDEADAAFGAVLARAPDYVDAHLGRARVAARRGDPAKARAALDAAEAARPGADPEVAAARASLEPATQTGWRIDVSAAHSRLSNDLDSWSEATIAVGRRLDARSGVAGVIERTERFGRTDVFFDARYDRTLGAGEVYVALGGTPDADYRPELSLRVGGRAPLGGAGLSATLDAGVSRYVSGTVTTAQPGLEQTLLDGRLTLSARWINVWDEQDVYRSGYGLLARWDAGGGFRLRAGYADAPESSDGATVDVRAVNLGLDVDVTDRVTLRLNGLHEERDAYDRDEIGFGVGWRY